MSLPDLGKLLASAREMQSKMAEAQQRLAAQRIEGTAGGGMVRVVVDGQFRVHEVHIEKHMLDTGDAQMLGDLCAAAFNAALANAQRAAAEEMQQVTGGLAGGDGMGGLGGALGKLFGGGA